VRAIVEKQSHAERYGISFDAACVIILVFTTSKGCVTRPATNALIIPIAAVSMESSGCSRGLRGRCRPLTPSTSSPSLRRLFFIFNLRLVKKSIVVNVVTTNGTLRETVGFHPL